MLSLQQLKIKNFLSFGDHDTTVDFREPGGYLIAGKNGAGKSSLINAILWVFFGRTMHKANPGKAVMHWDAAPDARCTCSATLMCGTTITRSCGASGTELLVERAGDTLLNTRSTTPNQQLHLKSLYSLDWDTFTGSSFTTQCGKPWLKLSDPLRKTNLEYILRLDRLTTYVDVNKEKVALIVNRSSTASTKLASIRNNIARTQTELATAEAALASFQSNNQAKYDQEIARIAASEGQLAKASANRPDVTKLRASWAAYSKVEELYRGVERKNYGLSSEVRTLLSQQRSLNDVIAKKRAKSGTRCGECGQEVTDQAVSEAIGPDERRLAELSAELAEKQSMVAGLTANLATMAPKIAAAKPGMSVEEAVRLNGEADRLAQAIASAKSKAELLLTQENPHGSLVERLKSQLAAFEAEEAVVAKEVASSLLLQKHYDYHQKAYSDRRKIKGMQIAKYVPLFNARLAHYLDRFQVPLQIKLTDALGVTTDKWGYEWLSGGEQQRADVSFSLAVFDVHEELYGRQCDMIVLDEVDSKLDKAGILSLVKLIQDELTPRVKNVLVISHKNVMLDMFPTTWVVHRQDGASRVDTDGVFVPDQDADAA